MDQFATKASGGLKMSENENPDHLELMRLLQEAKPLTEPLFPDQQKKWAAESPLAQEISAILVNHPEYYDEIRAHIGEVFANPHGNDQGETEMNTITTKDGTKIYFKDWGAGPTVVFSHGWPLNADAWDAQMLFFAQKGYRAIAHDRRGHGRSSQPWNGNEMDTYADDLAALIEKLDLKDITLVGHSTGGGELARYIGRHGSKRVSKAVLIGAVPPIMLKTENNPGGLPLSVFDQIRASVVADRSQFFKDLSLPFYGYNKPDAKISEGVRDSFWRQGMQVSIVGAYDCIKAFSETDFTGDLKKIDVPTLVLHGDADQIVPIADSGLLTAKIVKNATLKVITGAPHGMCTTRADEINAALLAFLKIPAAQGAAV